MMIPITKPHLTSEDAQAAYETILSGWVTQGPKVQEFEERFAAYVGAKYAVAVSSCTAALHLAMIVAGIGPGDEVICPSFSFIATANSIKYAGATPVFADIEPNTYNLDLADVEKRITPNTKAVLLVHQMGMPADIDAFRALCDAYHVQLIEDAACAIGSSYKGRKIGSHSDLVCFSFHPRKVISTGDGGMITTPHEAYAQRLKLLRHHGMSVSDRTRHQAKTVIIEDYVEVGYNYRMTDIQASVGITQLEKLDWLVEERRKIAFEYLDALQDLPCLRLPYEPDGYRSNYQSFSIYLQPSCRMSRNECMQRLLEAGIATRPGIMIAHRTTAYKSLPVQLPISERVSDNSIILPLYVPMPAEARTSVIQQLTRLLSLK
ncbi:aminotransferase class I/II-fold pyridoxal phosphate-dependent enzyme [candidate division KSB3 bacterium]|uniref:Aminotransferase class I/II-fold pyridoxal phosphate-dependent enzyme n=1 Tax=candidate division KSB3 bacterium TaxID=2044937 RepID=A0A9D5Q7Z9_9BACT|nr:aminotransferase class I/II-fold pyridoxal phosphate-dependent enzyme [candidate division KSB3 bacterium]MBD3326968.1 aminotransferase class I/II-fold pyridoxal phosphate-dependent enzyme [candidate division KSB3 bacterium]